MYRYLLICSLFLFGACSARYAAPVNEIDAPRFLDTGRTHRVNGGETLYAVAWMYDLDVNLLARANNLREPYAIEPGQVLTVDLRAFQQGATQAVARPAPTPAVPRPVVSPTAIQRTPLESSPLPRESLPSTSPSVPSATTPAPQREPDPPSAQVAIIEPLPSAPPLESSGPIRWDWPARGNVIGRFSASGVENKGIDIGGSEGDTVTAAADGEVVYAGNGLLRYGNLVILKHSDRFLSAYAHNSTIMVREGDRVTRGQKIAELGSSGISRNMLHFEIREDGQPVDPLGYLPSR